jgi:hypothetical protein
MRAPWLRLPHRQFAKLRESTLQSGTGRLCRADHAEQVF